MCINSVFQEKGYLQFPSSFFFSLFFSFLFLFFIFIYCYFHFYFLFMFLFFMFALSQFSGPDYLVAWNRLVHKMFVAIGITLCFISGKKCIYYGDISFCMRGSSCYWDPLRNISKKDAMYISIVSQTENFREKRIEISLKFYLSAFAFRIQFSNIVQVRKKWRKRNSVGWLFVTKKTLSVFLSMMVKATAFFKYNRCTTFCLGDCWRVGYLH